MGKSANRDSRHRLSFPSVSPKCHVNLSASDSRAGQGGTLSMAIAPIRRRHANLAVYERFEIIHTVTDRTGSQTHERNSGACPAITFQERGTNAEVFSGLLSI